MTKLNARKECRALMEIKMYFNTRPSVVNTMIAVCASIRVPTHCNLNLSKDKFEGFCKFVKFIMFLIEQLVAIDIVATLHAYCVADMLSVHSHTILNYMFDFITCPKHTVVNQYNS